MSSNKTALNFLTGEDNERRRKQFKRHEKELAAHLGGRTTIGSGNKGMKGDVQAGKLMAEAKSTQARSISLKLEWLEKLVREALEVSMEPALFIRFEAMHHSGMQDWAVIPASRYFELLETNALDQ